MPNLVGIGNSQVPTNAMLGGLAYQDSVGEIDIDKIKAQTGDTAVDIFVYDTSKDSDGGAWRHRTQNKSWYNEGSSQKRGSRKEFPAVAVIVAEAREVTIYDGDDPNLSMWMIFDAGETTNYGAALQFWGTSTAGTVSSVFMLNGQMVVGTNNGSDNGIYVGMSKVDFLNESMEFRRNFSNQYIKHALPISKRNEIQYAGTAHAGGLAGGDVTDVAMTVLPNAPIDASTGLPVPTIAVATDGGVSVIKNDGSVVSKTTTQLNSSTLASTYFHKNIDISGENAVVNYEYTYTGGYAQLMVVTLDNLTVLRRYGRDYTNTSSHPYFNSGTTHRHFPKQIYKNNHIFTREQSNDSDPAGSSNGILTIFEDQTSPSNGLINRISSSFNTGYMVGDIKGAFLSDTDDTNATELVNNHNFNGGITGWTTLLNGASGGSPGITVVSNKLKFQQGSSNSVWLEAYQDITTVVGKKYLLNIDIASANTSANWRIYTPSSSKILGYPSYLNQGQHSNTFTATSTTTRIRIQQGGAATVSGEVNSVSVKLVDDDRSINGNYLTVFGTIEKHAVATGAELVGYRPDSSSLGSNYLKLPLTSSIFDLTGDWCITFWVKNNGNASANYSGFEIAPDDITGNSGYSLIPFSMYIQGDGRLGLRGASVTGNNAGDNYILNIVDVWRCIHIVQKSGTLSLYIDGEFDSSTSATFANPSSAYALSIFRWTYSTTRHDGRRHIDFSLFRMSETAPTEEQIEKMYNDEKCLFHENAKCTLHGTSDDVKALAFDDTTNVLHVGTSSGRSEFQGLSRINNTTTAVTTAISASNELVAEQ